MGIQKGKNEICFLLPVLSDAHFRRRISLLHIEGINIKIAGFDRPYYAGKPWEYPVFKIGFRKHGKYLLRVFSILPAVNKVCKWAHKCRAIYSFGFEMLFLGWLCKIKGGYRKKLVYEVADIHSLMTDRGMISSIIRSIERLMLNYVDLVVVTSPWYKKDYFCSVQNVPCDKIIVIENKIAPEEYKSFRGESLSQTFDGYKNDGVVRIGYFGLLRGYNAFEVLKNIVERANGRIKVILAGYFLDKVLQKKILAYDKFEYLGEYKSPDDLKYIYSRVDWIWIANFLYKNHWKWARTNRFYEACFFKKPIIAQSGSADGLEVIKEKIGIVIDVRNVDKAVDEVMHTLINNSNLYSKFKTNMLKLPLKKYVYSDEHKKLIQKLGF